MKIPGSEILERSTTPNAQSTKAKISVSLDPEIRFAPPLYYLYFFSQNTNYFGSSFQAPHHTITYPAAACNDRHNSHQNSTLGEAEAAQDHPDLQFQRPERIYSAGENRDFFLEYSRNIFFPLKIHEIADSKSFRCVYSYSDVLPP